MRRRAATHIRGAIDEDRIGGALGHPPRIYERAETLVVGVLVAHAAHEPPPVLEEVGVHAEVGCGDRLTHPFGIVHLVAPRCPGVDGEVFRTRAEKRGHFDRTWILKQLRESVGRNAGGEQFVEEKSGAIVGGVGDAVRADEIIGASRPLDIANVFTDFGSHLHLERDDRVQLTPQAGACHAILVGCSPRIIRGVDDLVVVQVVIIDRLASRVEDRHVGTAMWPLILSPDIVEADEGVGDSHRHPAHHAALVGIRKLILVVRKRGDRVEFPNGSVVAVAEIEIKAGAGGGVHVAAHLDLAVGGGAVGVRWGVAGDSGTHVEGHGVEVRGEAFLRVGCA